MMLIFVSNFEFKRVSIMSSRILKVRQSQNDFSSQKSNKQIILYYYETLGRLVFVCFFEAIEDTKKTFRNYLTFREYFGKCDLIFSF